MGVCDIDLAHADDMKIIIDQVRVVEETQQERFGVGIQLPKNGQGAYLRDLSYRADRLRFQQIIVEHHIRDLVLVVRQERVLLLLGGDLHGGSALLLHELLIILILLYAQPEYASKQYDRDQKQLQPVPGRPCRASFCRRRSFVRLFFNGLCHKCLLRAYYCSVSIQVLTSRDGAGPHPARGARSGSGAGFWGTGWGPAPSLLKERSCLGHTTRQENAVF